MANDSTAAGFLVPTSAFGLVDDALDDYIHDTLAGVTGLDGTNVRPRIQAEPPNLQGKTVPWMAFGVSADENDVFESQTMQDDGEHAVVGRRQILTVLVSCYGPSASAMDAQLRAGLSLSQNRALLRQQGLYLLQHTNPTVVPSLVKNTFLRRVDSTLTLTRYLEFTYQVRSLVDLAGLSQLDNEQYLTPIVIHP